MFVELLIVSVQKSGKNQREIRDRVDTSTNRV